MAAYRALGSAGGAGGVEERQRVRGRDEHLGPVLARPSDQRLVVMPACDRAANGDEPVRRHRHLAPGLLHEPGEACLGEEGAGAAIAGDEGDLGTLEAEVDRHRDQPGQCRGSVDLEPFQPVVGEDAETVALGQAEADKRIGEPAGAGVPGGIGQVAVEVRGADVVRSQAAVVGEHVAEIREPKHRVLPHCTEILP